MSAPPNDATATSSSGGWRESVAQSFRSEEVRSVAKVLASLESGATSASKTMLAMRFEESIFKAASDLEDYRKTIQKRLKKLKKHYAKQQAAETTKAGGTAENADLTREKELLLEGDLRDKYGGRLLYIAKHADEAVESTRQKHGDHKAHVLRQHATNAKQWAVHLGLELPVPAEMISFTREEKRDIEFLNKLKSYFENRVENIRSHIVKMVDPDLFLEDALLKIDNALLKEKVSEVFRKALREADPDNPEFTGDQMKELMERMNVPVPIPRRNQEGERIIAAVARIEKIRAAAQALYTYMGLTLADKTSFRGAMEKCHAMVMECLTELEGEYGTLVKEVVDKTDEGKRKIKLEDSWNNPMQFAESESEAAPPIEDVSGEEPDSKRQKTEEASQTKAPMVIRTRILLTKGRNIFSTLLPALKRKKANLVRNSAATFVTLEFGTAFEMTVYFAPLLVTIRAMSPDSTDGKSSMASLSGGINWPSLYQGLCPSEKDSTDDNASVPALNVLGVTGSYASLGAIIARKLEYASAQATYVLRRCFAEATANKSTKSDFEIEILEAGALIRFLQFARSTYSPDWIDVDA